MTSTTGSTPDGSGPATSVGPSALRRADGVGARLPLPEGTLPVGLGVLIAGICSFAFFRVGSFALGEDGFKPVAALWFATFALAPGFFLPLVQELGRALSARRAFGEGGRPVVRRVSAVTASLGTLATPVIGVVATVLVLGERPSTADIVGFALIFTASACVVFAPLLRAKTR